MFNVIYIKSTSFNSELYILISHYRHGVLSNCTLNVSFKFSPVLYKRKSIEAPSGSPRTSPVGRTPSGRTFGWRCNGPGVPVVSEQRRQRSGRGGNPAVAVALDISIVENTGGKGKGTRTEVLEIHPTRAEREDGKGILRTIS